MAHLLVVEDDDTIGTQLTDGLATHGHRVTWARTGAGALRESKSHDFELVLLDLGLPDLDGVHVCRELRAAQPGAVVVILTARDAEIDVVVGLDAGADDYLTKPFRFAELLARIRAHLRRGSVSATAESAIAIGELVIDTGSRVATFNGHRLKLRSREYDLLARLVADADTAVSRTDLMADVWDEHWYGSTKTLDVHVGILRRKLADAADQYSSDPSATPTITTLRGFGYRLDSPPGRGDA
ncbi:response regulator transcription factor [Mycolicibacterium arenosum]|uniref:Response regulator transcription factor n=1 Tax=Mycolicibacterium arenosum TaxID=2952157 RepID=A0ABT1MC62_9MYCO|nr:response regulator transcription factor [Mycolicibacterium sp. CAU 1645]MCP9276457.1 response regulator transcription factor [Mycolicibacterium sp. CAU 1645]